MKKFLKKAAFLILTLLLLKNVYTPVLANCEGSFLREDRVMIKESR